MTTKAEKRLKKLWRLAGGQLGGMLVTSPENVRYLSGFTGTEGTLVLTRDGGFFFTDGRYTTQACQQVQAFEVITFRRKLAEIGRLLKKKRLSPVGFESRSVTVSFLRELEREARGVQFVPCDEQLDGLRAVKDAAEIRLLKKAARIASESLAEILPLIRPGISETDVAAELEFRMRRRGGDAAAFQTIVASGLRSALPHGTASEKKIENGDLVTIDYGAVYQGFCSDETCTFVAGRPSAKQKKIYETVRQAHDLALEAVCPGRLLSDVDAAARMHIDGAGYKRYFNHGTGHGVGLCVHEPPVVSFRSRATMQKGMVFTVEPGIYLPGWGGVRIEDTVCVTADGYELITPSNKDLQSIGDC